MILEFFAGAILGYVFISVVVPLIVLFGVVILSTIIGKG